MEPDVSKIEVKVTEEASDTFSTPLAPERSRKSLIDTPGTLKTRFFCSVLIFSAKPDCPRMWMWILIQSLP